jgi:hypothetical protein
VAASGDRDALAYDVRQLQRSAERQRHRCGGSEK